MDQLSIVLKGLAQQTLTAFHHMLIHHFRKTFPWSDLKLLCTAEVAETSFSLTANFLAEAQDAGLGQLFHNVWQCRLQVIQG